MRRLSELKKKVRRLVHPFRGIDATTVRPFEPDFGFHRGKPIDRHYIDLFLGERASLIRGNVAEISEPTYAKKFGCGVEEIYILGKDGSSGHHTLNVDLELPLRAPENLVDCFICTQTLNFIFDFRAGIETIHRMLKPKGTALVTLAGVSQISVYDETRWGDYWRFTRQSAQRLFDQRFSDVEVVPYGNALSATAFFQGVVCEDMPNELLDRNDSVYPIVIGVRARK